MELDIENIAEYYTRLSDQDLIRISTQEARGLRPEVIGVIEIEIKKRNLNPDFLKCAIALNKEYTIDELENYSESLIELPCTLCRQTKEKLNGTVAHSVMSFLVFTMLNSESFVACTKCLDN